MAKPVNSRMLANADIADICGLNRGCISPGDKYDDIAQIEDCLMMSIAASRKDARSSGNKSPARGLRKEIKRISDGQNFSEARTRAILLIAGLDSWEDGE